MRNCERIEVVTEENNIRSSDHILESEHQKTQEDHDTSRWIHHDSDQTRPAESYFCILPALGLAGEESDQKDDVEDDQSHARAMHLHTGNNPQQHDDLEVLDEVLNDRESITVTTSKEAEQSDRTTEPEYRSHPTATFDLQFPALMRKNVFQAVIPEVMERDEYAIQELAEKLRRLGGCLVPQQRMCHRQHCDRHKLHEAVEESTSKISSSTSRSPTASASARINIHIVDIGSNLGVFSLHAIQTLENANSDTDSHSDEGGNNNSTSLNSLRVTSVTIAEPVPQLFRLAVKNVEANLNVSRQQNATTSTLDTSKVHLRAFQAAAGSSDTHPRRTGSPSTTTRKKNKDIQHEPFSGTNSIGYGAGGIFSTSEGCGLQRYPEGENSRNILQGTWNPLYGIAGGIGRQLEQHPWFRNDLGSKAELEMKRRQVLSFERSFEAELVPFSRLLTLPSAARRKLSVPASGDRKVGKDKDHDKNKATSMGRTSEEHGHDIFPSESERLFTVVKIDCEGCESAFVRDPSVLGTRFLRDLEEGAASLSFELHLDVGFIKTEDTQVGVDHLLGLGSFGTAAAREGPRGGRVYYFHEETPGSNDKYTESQNKEKGAPTTKTTTKTSQESAWRCEKFIQGEVDALCIGATVSYFLEHASDRSSSTMQ
ncbi:unnamed protein product [Amoebophrya sp. A25]|nr:unnamed protein product [Amoebophrya sp. A25]|eukprot:GSA25T00025214001.1